MISINMRLFKMVLLLGVFWTKTAWAHPVGGYKETSAATTSTTTTMTIPTTIGDHYDQRQNGTDNYRINVDGVVVVVAPIEALLLASAVGSESNLSSLDQAFIKPNALKSDNSAVEKSSGSLESTNRSNFRVANLIAPLLHRLHHK